MNVSQVHEKLPPAFVVSNKRNVQKYSLLLVVVLVLHKYGFCLCLSPCLTRMVWTTTPVSFSLLHKYDDSDVEPLPTSVSTSPGWCWTATCICLSTSMITLVLNHYLHLSLCKYDDIDVEVLPASFSQPYQDGVEPLTHKCDDIDVEPLPVYFYLTSVMTLMLNHYLYLSLYFTRCWTSSCLFLSDYIDVEPLPAPVSLLHKYDDINVVPLPASLYITKIALNHYLHISTSMTTLMLNHYLHISPYKYNDADVEPPSASFSPGSCRTLPASFINQA